MPFTKVGKDDYTSPSGRHFNTAQVRLWHANGNKFPGQKHSEDSMPAYASGGPVYSRTKNFAKEDNKSKSTRFGALNTGKNVDFMAAKNEFLDPDHVNPNADEDNLYAKSGEGEGKGCYTPPAPTSK